MIKKYIAITRPEISFEVKPAGESLSEEEFNKGLAINSKNKADVVWLVDLDKTGHWIGFLSLTSMYHEGSLL